ncbi:hypothetical protein [Streptomyces corynorhini]|uniref:hypothetical protein n=1 Tax=Streptomyces corynorhini TaxID=2282652 RepID=UPI001F278580|nr:hypothetical protein [Streptomyces corynorhini]
MRYEVTGGWFRLWSAASRLDLFDGYATPVSVALIVAGVRVGAASVSAARGSG